ncbi:hypothetical protein HPULCUR_007201 [Helicostylum pulchrum]|uniref:Beta-lactamase n=1 Tax=Helicostylum pulchrum TaxID=562976 RepID=A0ABP9Y443_9FUNG
MRPQPPGSKSFREGNHFYGVKNYEEALHRWEKASSLNNVEATLRAADLYNEGKKRLLRDPVKALKLYKFAAYLSQDTLARYKIGLMYFLGDGVQQNFEHAFTYFQLAANDGCFSAELALAHLYYTGQGVEKDFYKAFILYVQTADHPKCILGIAKLYHHGHGTFLQDSKQAISGYQRAGDQGDVDAIYELGCICIHGRLGTKINYAYAMRIFLMADKMGHVDSIVNIGILYFYGRGVELDIDKAQFFIGKALRIDQEHGLANYYAAKCYIAKNNGSPDDLIIEHYVKAADSRHSGALLVVGRFYEDGLMGETNIEKAIICYQRAIDADLNDLADDNFAKAAKDALRRLKPNPTDVAVQHKHVPPATVVKPKPESPVDTVKHTPLPSSTTTVIQPSADVKSKPMSQIEEEHEKMRLVSLKLKQRLELSENERLRIEQELKEKLELSEKERLRIEQESKEKDEQIRILTLEKGKMQQFQMQLVLDLAGKGDQSNKRMRYTVD